MKQVTAELLTIGDEILYGQIVDTNSQWMSVALTDAGVKVIRKTSVPDSEPEILIAFAEAEQRADIILITGGLGPTSDDITKPCLTKYFNSELVMNEEALAEVTEFFKSRGRELTELNRQQAALPKACIKITNPVGTAPGMWFTKGNKVFMSMPGVPHEMKRMMTEQVIPRIKSQFDLPVIHHKIIRTIGQGESFLADKIVDWEKALPSHIKLAYLPSLGEVKLRLTCFGDDLAQLQKDAELQAQALNKLIGQYIYAFEDETIEVAIGKMLKENNLTISIAESCTGGKVSQMITSVPGSSEYFQGSIIPYSYDIKMSQLGVSANTLNQFGAVSEQTIKEMATLVRQKFNTSIGIATSGIAGPGGATAEKPVGTVWIAYADGERVITKKLQLTKERALNIQLSSMAVLNLIRLGIKESMASAALSKK